MLSEIARANVEERSWPWWTCEGRISTLQHEERCLSNCHLMTIIAIQSVRHTRRCIYAEQPETDEVRRVPVRVEATSRERTLSQLCMVMNDITIGGERKVSGGIPHQNDIEKVRDQEASDRGRSRP